MPSFINQSLYEAVKVAVEKNPSLLGIYYKGKKISLGKFLKRIDEMADILTNQFGIKEHDVVMISQPNVPSSLVVFYALNKIGAIANMVHPFTPYNQIVNIYNKTNTKLAILFEQRIAKEVHKYITFPGKILVTRIEDDLPILKKCFYHTFMNGKIRKKLAKRRKFPGFDYLYKYHGEGNSTPIITDKGQCAVLLHSGSTTGEPKTICLTSRNFNYICENASDMYCTTPEGLAGTGMLCVLPSFHGFGLCMSMHITFTNHIACLMMPKFSSKEVVKYMNKTKKVNCIVGVPNMYEKLVMDPKFRNNKHLKDINICWCGGDALPVQLQNSFNDMVKAQGGKGELFQGYGLTEAVAANCVNNYKHSKQGSLGYPIPNAEFVILDEKGKKLPINTLGEICIKSEAVMIEYFEDKDATSQALRDGYLHTGDLGTIDEEGFIFFKQRAKRVIKVSGVAVFPGEIESLISLVPGVKGVCAIRIPDPILISAVKLFIVANYVDEEGMRQTIMDNCRKYLIKWAVPKEIEFIEKLPLTKLGKVDFRLLQEQEDKKRLGNIS